MSLAELKRRLNLGTQLRLVERPGRQCDELKTVALVQTNAVAFGLPGCKRGDLAWIWWTKGMRVESTFDGFKLIWPNDNYLRYQWAPPIPAAADPERASKLDAERVTWEFRAPSARRLDAGRQPIEDSPLFGGARQESLF